MVKILDTKWLEDLLKFIIGLSILIILNQLSGQYFARLDLTEESRYTIKPATHEILQNLDDNIYVDVYLEGDLNSAFKRFQKSIRETLNEFTLYSNGKVIYNFIDPGTAKSQNARNEFMAELASKGIQPTNIIDTRDGQRTEKIIFPGAVISYGTAEKGVMLLQGLQGEEQLNSSIENIEYNLIKTIYQLTNIERKKILFLQGHGEADSASIFSLQNSLFNFYNIQNIDVSKNKDIPQADLAIIAKPTKRWPETDKYKLDQFIMQGGKALIMIDRMDANMDSANHESNVSFAIETGLDDLLFRYGVRVNPDLVQDNNAALYPIVTSQMGEEVQITPIPWPYYPVLNHYGDHPLSKNMDAVLGRFVNTIDTVKAEGITKTPLIMTSPYSRSIASPAPVSVADLRKNLKPELLNQANLPVSWLLEGEFTSIYKNRFLPKGTDKTTFIEQGKDSKIIVIGDGDFGINDVNPQTGEPQPLGRFNFQPQMNFANENFLINAISYLIDENGIITARNKEIKIRPLNKVKMNEEKLYWQTLNLVLPVLLIFMMGIVYVRIRKKVYTNFRKND